MFESWSEENPELRKQWDEFFGDGSEGLRRLELPAYNVGEKAATRSAGGKALLAVVNAVPNVVGGSADLASSNKTEIPEYGDFTTDTPTGRTLHFGVREHGMGAITNGMALYGGLRPFCATFLVFSDYMRPSIRLASLMGLPVVYVFTHDSIYVGEDGPTHQPVEHYAALRCIPGLTFIRPADAEETNQAWVMALENSSGPTAMALTRQNLPIFEKADTDWSKTMRRGAYIAKEAAGEPKTVLIATGSEVSLALEVAEKVGDTVRVVSMPCRELFVRQDEQFRESIVPANARRVVIEVGVSLGWGGIAGNPQDIVVLDRYGASGNAGEVAGHFGFTADAVIKKLGL
jgi:transketolase